MERGTLFNLRNKINRRNVSKNCKTDLNAHEDFFELVVEAYIVCAVKQYLKMNTIDDVPSEDVLPNSSLMWMEEDGERLKALMSIAVNIASQHIDIQTNAPKHTQSRSKSTDKVLSYSNEVMTLGLLLFEFKDAIKEGDGDRCLRLWKYFLLVFKASGRKNYAMEAFHLLIQYHIVLPPRLAEGVKWSRFVNTRGLPGHNISCDLHMEHMNKLVKTSIEGLGANKAQKSIIRCGKMVGTLESTLDTFDKDNDVTKAHGVHAKAPYDKDFLKVVEQLSQMNVFSNTPGRDHKSFTHIHGPLIKSPNTDVVREWILDNFLEKYL